MNRLIRRAGTVASVLLSVSCASAATRHGSVTVQLTDPGPALSFELEPHFALSLDYQGPDGWDLDVRDERAPESGNLLYHSREWHGPYPTQIYAWHVARNYFPNDRWLCVYRHHPQYEVHAVLRNPVVAGTPERPSFVGGTLTVEWWRRRCR